MQRLIRLLGDSDRQMQVAYDPEYPLGIPVVEQVTRIQPCSKDLDDGWVRQFSTGVFVVERWYRQYSEDGVQVKINPLSHVCRSRLDDSRFIGM